MELRTAIICEPFFDVKRLCSGALIKIEWSGEGQGHAPVGFCFRCLFNLRYCRQGVAADVEPIPAPPPPPGPLVILTAHALDGHGGTLEDARIGVADGKITSLAAPRGGTVIDLRGYTVMPGWIDTHVHLSSHFD